MSATVINPYVFGVAAPTEKLWAPTQTAVPITLSGFQVRTFYGTPIYLVIWGDGTTQSLSSSAVINKTFTTPSTGIYLTPETEIRTITCGSSSPKLGGVINISEYPRLQDFRCNNNDVTAVYGYAQNSNLGLVQFNNNKVTGELPSLSDMGALYWFGCHTNQLTGSIPSLSGLSNLTFFSCHTNGLSGPLPSLSGLNNLRVFECYSNLLQGTIPSLSGLSNLEEFRCHVNLLSGSLPDLSTNTKLTNFQAQDNNLAGNLPSLSGLTALKTFHCSLNKLTGSIPDLSGLNSLEFFHVTSNFLQDFAGGSVPNTLGNFQAQNNLLSSTAINALLAAFVAAGRTSADGTCLLYLDVGNNAAPTGQGLTDKATLLGRGWDVRTN